MKTPTPDEMHIAAMWLDVNEGAEDREACQRVREWLLAQADKREFEQTAKRLAKETGRSLTDIRARMRQMQ